MIEQAENIERARTAAREIEMANRLADTLNQVYPRHLWAVNVDLRGGVIHIRNLFLSGKWGFLLKIADYLADEKRLTMAAGELLERYRLHRGSFKEDEYHGLYLDFAGNPMADH